MQAHKQFIIDTLINTSDVPAFREMPTLKLNKAVQTDPINSGYVGREKIVSEGKQSVPLQIVKIDALWKPIIRKFRQHIKQKVMKHPLAR